MKLREPAGSCSTDMVCPREAIAPVEHTKSAIRRIMIIFHFYRFLLYVNGYRTKVRIETENKMKSPELRKKYQISGEIFTWKKCSCSS